MRNDKKAVTLLEMVFVLVLVGAIIIALIPKVFQVFEFSRSAEAINVISAIRSSLDRCFLRKGGYKFCTDDWDLLDIGDPGLVPNTYFDYEIQILDVPDLFDIIAVRNSLDGGEAGDMVIFTFHKDGSVTKSGTGKFINVQ
jgi:type II secretory pathway pseudopilin PulG